MKRFLLGVSALLLTAAMGFAQPTVRPATLNGNSSPRLESASWFHHRNKHEKKHFKKHRNHRRDDRYNNQRGRRNDNRRDHNRDNYQYRPNRGY